MELGDKVPGGKIVGIVTASYWAATGGLTRSDTHPYNDKYPGWLNKNMVYVELDNPQKVMSFEEACEQWPMSLTQEEQEQLYGKLPVYSYLALPEDAVTVELWH